MKFYRDADGNTFLMLDEYATSLDVTNIEAIEESKTGFSEDLVSFKQEEQKFCISMNDMETIKWVYVKTLTGGIYHELETDARQLINTSLSPKEIEEIYFYGENDVLWRVENPFEHITQDDGYQFSEMVCSLEFPQGCIDELEGV